MSGCKASHSINVYNYSRALYRASLGPLLEGAVSKADWGSVLCWDTTLPPSLPSGKATSLKEGGKGRLLLHMAAMISSVLHMPGTDHRGLGIYNIDADGIFFVLFHIHPSFCLACAKEGDSCKKCRGDVHRPGTDITVFQKPPARACKGGKHNPAAAGRPHTHSRRSCKPTFPALPGQA